MLSLQGHRLWERSQSGCRSPVFGQIFLVDLWRLMPPRGLQKKTFYAQRRQLRISSLFKRTHETLFANPGAVEKRFCDTGVEYQVTRCASALVSRFKDPEKPETHLPSVDASFREQPESRRACLRPEEAVPRLRDGVDSEDFKNDGGCVFRLRFSTLSPVHLEMPRQPCP
ncbi:hypothetical protein TGMAS_262125 [Toxoplasma gondii MAS]|uniref:Uncharacterized protein n=1 Tax=Toxoplasma gondii MAS TaxID=943118 RepID=A0A086QS15_TOXGO|nr:hypothetical protein TGMAS_262125 [Toxoplasma gondii MAS]